MAEYLNMDGLKTLIEKIKGYVKEELDKLAISLTANTSARIENVCGDKLFLTTQNRTNLVGAINEINAKQSSGGVDLTNYYTKEETDANIGDISLLKPDLLHKNLVANINSTFDYVDETAVGLEDLQEAVGNIEDLEYSRPGYENNVIGCLNSFINALTLDGTPCLTLRSPNGDVYAITVDNDGNLTTAKVTNE